MSTSLAIEASTNLFNQEVSETRRTPNTQARGRERTRIPLISRRKRSIPPPSPSPCTDTDEKTQAVAQQSISLHAVANDPPSPPNPLLSVERLSKRSISEVRCEKLRELMTEWRKKCYLMLGHAEKHQDGKKVVRDLKLMTRIVKQSLDTKSFDVIAISKDTETSTIQGIALVDMQCEKHTFHDYITINDIVTNPDNVRGSVNLNPEKKISGVGTSLISEISKLCREKGKKGIYLKALPRAKGFYERYGFQPYGKEKSIQPMFLPVEKMTM